MNKKVKNVKVNPSTLDLIRKNWSKEGVLTGLVLAGSLALAMTYVGHEIHEMNEGYEAEQAVIDRMLVETTYDNIKDIQLVLDNSGIDDKSYQDILSILRQDGIPFRQHQEGLPVTEDETVISLTSNDYVEGDVALYGPKEHENSNNDNLMMSFCSACSNASLEMERVHFGRITDWKVENTSLENRIGDDATMITLQFKDPDVSPVTTASVIENGIIRYAEQVEIAPDKTYFYSLGAGETIGEVMDNYQMDSKYFYDLNGFDYKEMVRAGTAIQVRGADTYALDPHRTPTISKEDQKTI